jgi:hypothetical protein
VGASPAAWTECCPRFDDSRGLPFRPTLMDVAEWLRDLGLEQYAPAFRDNDIDGKVLCGMPTSDVEELASILPGRFPGRAGFGCVSRIGFLLWSMPGAPLS